MLTSKMKEIPLSSAITPSKIQPTKMDACWSTHGIENRPAPTMLFTYVNVKRKDVRESGPVQRGCRLHGRIPSQDTPVVRMAQCSGLSHDVCK